MALSPCAGAVPVPARPVGLFEAEEGFLRGVGLEDTAEGFSGFAYVAGWSSRGEGVDLIISVPSPAAYRLAFRYAADGPATRRIRLDGQELASSRSFASTGAWSAYATVSLDQTLPAGTSTLSIDLTEANGGFLNLDSLVVTPR